MRTAFTGPDRMRVLVINGSPRKNGNTASLLMAMTGRLQGRGDTVVYRDLVDMNIRDCIGCNRCKRIDACALHDDMVPIYRELREADALIIGSPIYVGAETGITKCFLDRIYALLAPGDGPQGVITRLPKGKRAFAIFPCRRRNGATLYADMVRRYEEVFGMLGIDGKAMVLPEIHGDMDVLGSEVGRGALEACKNFLLQPRSPEAGGP
ncbi:MAG: flavodoxin family protein [Methanomassiliicoccus sp.]|nr:flavodoxin family protein [Methanomassiliicoccus sp.]